MNKYNSLYEIFGGGIKEIIAKFTGVTLDKLEEIRLRAGKPLAANCTYGQSFVSPDGSFTKDYKAAYIVTQRDIAAALTLISEYSLYAFEEEIRSGFITIKGGHRIGICGKTVIENKSVRTIKNVSSLNIRISHEIKGCADGIMGYVLNGKRVRHTLIVSPPGCGKTTLLRDIVRQLSDGKIRGYPDFGGVDIAVVDERSEIAGTYMGMPQNDVGIRTDVLDCCPKAAGMHMLLRSMSPTVVAVDEIGKSDDIIAIEEMLNAGIKLICTVHGEGIEDLRRKPHLGELADKKLFETIVVLSAKAGAGKLEAIYNENLEQVKEMN